MLDLVTTLSPHFIEPYLFSTFALIDAGKPQMAYDLLRRGQKANPQNWHLPFQLGFLAYTYGKGKARARVAAQWFTLASRLPGSRPFVVRLAAVCSPEAANETGRSSCGARSMPRVTSSRARRRLRRWTTSSQGEGGSHEGSGASLSHHAEECV